MLGHYLTVAYRNLTKSPLYTMLNVASLAIGLAACILILLYVRGEFSFDRWVPQGNSIIRVHTRYDIPGRQPFIAEQAPGPAMKAMQSYFPEVETGTRIHVRRPRIQRGDKVFFDRIYLVDPTFFEVFDLPLLEGERSTALKDTSSVILSVSMAKKYFGNNSPIGKTLTLDDDVRDREFKVTGVIADAPKNSHLRWDFIGRFEEAEFKKQPWIADTWTSVNMSMYLKLRPGADIDAFNAALPKFEEKVVPNTKYGDEEFPTHEFLRLSVMALPDLHLHSISHANAKPRYAGVVTFAAVAILILIIACINFMNLATARASQRAREVALRKVVGASRQTLILQFLGESTVLALVSLLFALGIVELALPAYNNFLDRTLELAFFGAGTLIPWLIALVAFVGLLGGLYPAVYLSRFRPAHVLKANKSSDAQGSVWLRSGLVVVQFAISIALIICTGVVYGQYRYTQTKDLGFDKGGLIIVRGMGRNDASKQSDVIKAEIAALPGVMSVTRSSDVPGDSSENNSPVQRPGETSSRPVVIGRYSVDWDFLKAYRVKLVAGRFFDETRSADDARFVSVDDLPTEPQGVISVLINERGVERLGYPSPQAAIGERLKFGGPGESMADVEIVGVLKNFHYRSIRQEIRPTIYLRQATGFNEISVRARPGMENEVMAGIESVWKRHIPTVPFSAEYLEETLKSLYTEERAQAQMFGIFAILAVIIACMGLYGLASFTAARRTKEIGIRKVLGASSWDIVKLLVWQFSKPVVFANVIAWPVAAYVMHRWLSTFEYRIGLEPVLFVVAGAIALLIAWGTVGGHAFRVSRTPPSQSLRYE